MTEIAHDGDDWRTQTLVDLSPLGEHVLDEPTLILGPPAPRDLALVCVSMVRELIGVQALRPATNGELIGDQAPGTVPLTDDQLVRRAAVLLLDYPGRGYIGTPIRCPQCHAVERSMSVAPELAGYESLGMCIDCSACVGRLTIEAPKAKALPAAAKRPRRRTTAVAKRDES